MTKWKRGILIGAGALLLIGIGSLITYTITRPKNALPASVSQQLTFSPFVATSNSKQTVSRYQVSKVENGTQTLTYHIATSGSDVTVTQYVQPSQFTDIPNYKEQFLSNIINQYATVQTSSGVIYLGRADKQNNHQIGVMLEKGLLLFLNPTEELSEEQWRSIGNSLMTVNTNT
jgi:hypothetical protein